MYKKAILFILLITLILTACNTSKIDNTPQAQEDGLKPIDIRAPSFFWLIQPWKEGKLVTIDRLGRFAEISFIGANRITIKPLVNFPRTGLDGNLMTWPEAGLIASTSGKVHHLAAIDDVKTKSHIPLLSWVHREDNPVLFDPIEGLIGYIYLLNADDKDIDTRLFIYNYREDEIIYESPEKGYTISPIFTMDRNNILCWERSLIGNEINGKCIFHNWKINKNTINDLVNSLNKNDFVFIIRYLLNIHLPRRILFGYSSIYGQRLKITWDNNYSNITVTPLSYLLPDESFTLSDFIFSANGEWVTTFISGYRGLRNERLRKRAFFHLDDRYPNGISMPVITEDYEEGGWDYSAFVNHPVHGMCFAQEWRKNGQLYLRLYKMDDVLAEINRQLAEKENIE